MTASRGSIGGPELGGVLARSGADEPDPVRLSQALDRLVWEPLGKEPAELVGLRADRAFERGRRGRLGHTFPLKTVGAPSLELAEDRHHLAGDASALGHVEGL